MRTITLHIPDEDYAGIVRKLRELGIAYHHESPLDVANVTSEEQAIVLARKASLNADDLVPAEDVLHKLREELAAWRLNASK